MFRTGARVVVSALAIGLWFAATPTRPAAASEFTDACAAAGGGLFEAKDCTCMDGKITDASERAALMAFFQANIAEQKGGPPPADTAENQKGMMILNKYLDQCLQ